MIRASRHYQFADEQAVPGLPDQASHDRSRRSRFSSRGAVCASRDHVDQKDLERGKIITYEAALPRRRRREGRWISSPTGTTRSRPTSASSSRHQGSSSSAGAAQSAEFFSRAATSSRSRRFIDQVGEHHHHPLRSMGSRPFDYHRRRTGRTRAGISSTNRSRRRRASRTSRSPDAACRRHRRRLGLVIAPTITSSGQGLLERPAAIRLDEEFDPNTPDRLALSSSTTTWSGTAADHHRQPTTLRRLPSPFS